MSDGELLIMSDGDGDAIIVEFWHVYVLKSHIRPNAQSKELEQQQPSSLSP